MLLLARLHAPKGSRKRRKRRGRGVGSGHGKTSCRGHKGLLSRSGAKLRHGFEGGQMPLIRRIPKRGFGSQRKKSPYQLVNVESLNKIKEKDTAAPDEMKLARLIKNTVDPVKVLGNGELKKALTVRAHAFSKSAIDKIGKAGGRAEIIKFKKETKE